MTLVARLMTRFADRLPFAVCALLLSLTGCPAAPEIRQYTVTKPEFVEKGSVEIAAAPPVELEPAVTWGAIWPRGQQAWFFKATTRPEVAKRWQSRWNDFVKTVKFSSQGEPEWALPEGWSQRPGDGMRFATVIVRDEAAGPVELSVSMLPRDEAEWDSQLEANLSRWKGQLGIGPVDNSAVTQSTEKIGDDEVTFVSLTGTKASGQPGMGMRPPGMNAPAGPMSNANQAPATTPPSPDPAASGLKFTAPPEWQPGKMNAFRKAAFEVTRDDQKVEITVIDLAGESGGLLENINRWRDQVGLPAIELAALTSELKSVKTAGEPAQLVELVGPQGKEAPGKSNSGQTIIGVIIPKGDRTWFVKLQGASPLAAAEKSRFIEFVSTLSVP
jgi:hypothetical protein